MKRLLTAGFFGVYILFYVCALSMFRICLLAGPIGTYPPLDAWVLGTDEPEVLTGTRGDGTSGEYLYLPVGTDMFYYLADEAGEGSVTF